MRYPPVIYIKATLDRATQLGQWYLFPEGCPMMAEKAAAGHPAPMACAGGMVATHDRLSIFTTCWHTHAGALHASYRQQAGEDVLRRDGYRVACSYLPARDYWDHPGGKIGEPREPQTSEPPDGASPGETIAAFLMPPDSLTPQTES